jgi:protein-disulfide isomerase
MGFVFKAFFLAVFVIAAPSLAHAGGDPMSERTLGKNTAPVKVDEFFSLTCSHCAEFLIKALPELEKLYIDTGKVRFILHDFPLNALSLKAAAVARCMPEDEYLPFIKTIYQSLEAGTFGGSDSEAKLYQYAALGGLASDKAEACADDAKLQDAITAERTEATTKYNIEATPAFVINDGAEIINGAQSVETFAAAFDRALAAKKK